MCANAILSACSVTVFMISLYRCNLVTHRRKTSHRYLQPCHETCRDASLGSHLESRASGIDCRRVNLKSPLITYFIISLSNYTTESFSFRDGVKFGARARDAFGKLLRESSLRTVRHFCTVRCCHREREREQKKIRAKEKARECEKRQEREREKVVV